MRMGFQKSTISGLVSGVVVANRWPARPERVSGPRWYVVDSFSPQRVCLWNPGPVSECHFSKLEAVSQVIRRERWLQGIFNLSDFLEILEYLGTSPLVGNWGNPSNDAVYYVCTPQIRKPKGCSRLSILHEQCRLTNRNAYQFQVSGTPKEAKAADMNSGITWISSYHDVGPKSLIRVQV